MPKTSVEKYGSVSGLTEQDVENTRRFLHDTSIDALDTWTEERTETHYIGVSARPYRMVVDRQSSQAAVVVTGEFATGITPFAVARARVVRDMVAPDASLLLQPNAGAGQRDNMNFSLSERATLRRGLALPLAHRLDRSLTEMGDPEDRTFYGPSQGGAIALEYAATLDNVAVATLEAPNVIERSRLEMARAFLGCGDLLKEVIKENYGEDMTNAPVISLKGLARFIAAGSRSDNLAIIDVLCSGTAQQRMVSILENGGSVVHAYAQDDAVSPLDKNSKIASTMVNYEKYRSVQLEGDHSISNNFALGGALARTAHKLLQTVV